MADTRTSHVFVRLRTDERQALEDGAEKMRMTLSAFVRAMALQAADKVLAGKGGRGGEAA